MTIWIYSDRPSDGAHRLTKEAGFRRMRKGKLVKKNDLVVNWGSTHAIPAGNLILNKPEAVKNAVNKLNTFTILGANGVSTVPWTSDIAVAKEWSDKGWTIVARKVLTGREGAGIIVVEKGNELPEAPLYTRYIFKIREFRVHATQVKVIDTQQKVRDPKREVKTWKIRSHANGFIFQRQNINPNPELDKLCMTALLHLGLAFGALDVIQDKDGNFSILEVNTAPGIEGTTVTRYHEAFREIANALA